MRSEIHEVRRTGYACRFVEKESISEHKLAKRQIPSLDLQAQHKQIRDEVLAEIVRVVDSQKFILGEDVKKLESEIASYSGAKHAIGCGLARMR